MSGEFQFILDGREVPADPGDTILAAADRAGVWIPRLCAHPDLEPFGSCRVCTVTANGRTCAACTQPVSPRITNRGLYQARLPEPRR